MPYNYDRAMMTRGGGRFSTHIELHAWNSASHDPSTDAGSGIVTLEAAQKFKEFPYSRAPPTAPVP